MEEADHLGRSVRPSRGGERPLRAAPRPRVTRPVQHPLLDHGLVGRIGPAGLTPRWQTAIAVVGLTLLWLLATLGKVWLCLSLGPGQCR